MILRLHKGLICLMVFITIGAGKVMAQSCSSSTPHYTVDMTGNPDSVWTSPSVSRDGLCCGASNPDRCIHFTVTLDADAQGLSVDVTGGTGTTYYNIGCSSSTLLGDTICLSGVGPHQITICKPGGNVQNYVITSVPKPHLDEDTVLINPSCQKILSAKGYNESTISWTSVGNNSTNNSYLSCTSGCDSTIVTLPSSGSLPSYIDYVVSGYNAKLACDTNKFYDTVRVFLHNIPTVHLSPKPAYICPPYTTVAVNANSSGGLRPYSYLWSNAATDSVRNLVAGTYWVRLTDSLGCYFAYDTVTVYSATKPAAVITGDDSLCQNATETYKATQLSGKTYQWMCNTAVITGSSVRDSSVITFNQAGTHTISLTVTDTVSGCDSTITKQVFVDSMPVATVTGNTPLCEGSFAEVYTATYNAAYTYSWAVSGGNIASGGNTNAVTVNWPSATSGYAEVTVTKSLTGCSQLIMYSVLVTPLPATGPINHH